MGGLGHQAPSNAVFRAQGDVTAAHNLSQWQGSSSYQAPIYHAPPETRVHAHKEVFQIKDQDGSVVPDSVVDPDPAVPDAEIPQDVGAFDFGQEFDYGKL